MLETFKVLLPGNLGLGLLLFLVGVVAGTINVIAGGGSFLTLPTLILLGLPAGVANGTNRVGILFQNVGAVWGFRRSGRFEDVAIGWRVLPAVLGAIVGVGLALQLDDTSFRRVLAVLMVVVFLGMMWSRNSGEDQDLDRWNSSIWAVSGAFFLVGVYGGFIQAGVGFLVLLVTSAFGLNLVSGNAVKVVVILGLTVVSLALFAINGKVDLFWGLCLAAGTVIGGQIGVRLTLTRGEAWVRVFLTMTAILFAVALWMKG